MKDASDKNRESLINFIEAQKRLGISRSTLLRWLKAGRITGYKAGRKWKFYQQDLDKLILRESTADYSPGINNKIPAEIKKIMPSYIESQDLSEIWCEWVDKEQWLSMTIYSSLENAWLTIVKNTQPAVHKAVSIKTANIINMSWELWSGSNSAQHPPRPGLYSSFTGINGYKITTLQLPADINRMPEFKESLPKNFDKLLNKPLPSDWYIYGPASRITAGVAYKVLLNCVLENKIKNSSIITKESEPTYYIGGAVQVYSGDLHIDSIGAGISLTQLSPGSFLPPRGISSPVCRIAYIFSGKPKNFPNTDNTNVITIKPNSR